MENRTKNRPPCHRHEDIFHNHIPCFAFSEFIIVFQESGIMADLLPELAVVSDITVDEQN